MRALLRTTVGLAAAGALGATVLVAGGPAASAVTPVALQRVDSTTGGNWSYTYDLAAGGTARAYNYGTFAYALPNSTGQFEYDQGGTLTHYPSLDETGGRGFGDGGYGGEQASYSVHGPVQPDDRTLLLPGGTQRRASSCFGPSVTMTLPLPAGSYRIAVYAVDYDRNGRMQTQLGQAGADSATQSVSGFSDGVYVLFDAASDGVTPLTFTAEAVAGPNAVVSAVFVDPLASPVSGITAVGQDTTTKGNWIGTYGSAGYVLCGGAVTDLTSAQPWAASSDLASGIPGYSISASTWAWTHPFTSGPITQPAYAYAWGDWLPQSSPDVASATFWKYSSAVSGPATPGMRRATSWDSGDDVWNDPGRPLVVDLHVPVNSGSAYEGFQAAFYFRDYDSNRSQRFTLTDVTRGEVVTTQQVSAFGQGVYYVFSVPAGTDLRLEVSATAGVNAVLSGIFLDEVAKPATGDVTDQPRTPGYWRNWKNKYSLEQFSALVSWARTAGGPVFPNLTVAQAESILGSNATTMANKLNTMFLAMLLNQADGLLRGQAVLNLDLVAGAPTLLGGHTTTVDALVTRIKAAYTGLNSNGMPTYSGWTTKQQELVKNVCEAVDHFAHHDRQDVTIIVG